MHASQYEITLPADYDMAVIRKRVADTGHLLDDRAGMGLKAYLIRRRGVDGSPVNQYAPFYLWNDAGAMAYFLAGGGGFQNIIRSFGRPAAQHWTGLAHHAGPAHGAAPKAASRLLTPVPADPDEDGTGLGTAAWTERALAEAARAATREDVHTVALALDTRHWQLLRFVLWRDAVAPEEQGERYEVLHVSAPEIGALPEGRAW